MKKFSEYVEENTLAEKDLGGGRFSVEESDDSVSITYTKGNDMNMFQMYLNGENISVALKVNGKEVIMNDMPTQKFVMKMREFLQKIK
jgi:hypothetical protein